MRTSLGVILLAIASTTFAKPKDGDDHPDPYGDDSNNVASSIMPSGSSTASSPSPLSSSSPSSINSSMLIGMNGGVVCTDLMCIGGLIHGSSIQYTLQSLGRASLGWIAMGFGSQMANSPMVIMWPNSDGSITLSQRMAPSEVMPTVVSNPPRLATLESALSVTTGSNPKYTFTINSDGSAKQNIIWAFGGSNPGDPSADATLLIHMDSGPTQLDLSGTLVADSKDPTNPVFTLAQSSTGSGGANQTGSTNSGDQHFSGLPLRTYEKYIIAHAILSVLGFLLCLPLGALVARWARTYSPIWFTLHWIIQFGLAMPLIVAGFAFGVSAVRKSGATPLNDTHKQWGLTIFVLYWVQIFLGAIIHFFKPRSSALKIRGRTVQNYFHAIFGLFIIGIAFYQVRTGFKVEWLLTGRGPVRNGANITWIVWLAVIAVLYFAGVFLLLRRQYRQEATARQAASAAANKSTDTY